MKEICVNGEQKGWEQAQPVDCLLRELGLGGKPVVVELNGEAIPRSQYEKLEVNPGDRVEIFSVFSGG